MLKDKIRNLLKRNQMIYNIYFLMMNTILKLFNLIYFNKKKIILFSSFAGKGFNDSPKAIYNYLKESKLLSNYKLIWAFEDPDSYPYLDNVIKIDTFEYFKIAISARAWVTNSSIERGLKFKSRGTYCLNTWHGTPLKKMGIDIEDSNESFKGKGNITADSFCVQGEYEENIFSRVFELGNKQIIRTGLPRNDALTAKANIKEIRKRMGIQESTFIILYAPTFREYDVVEGHPGFMQKDIISEIASKLPENTILLVRAHYEVANQFKGKKHDDKILNVSDYDDINDLYLIADCLISDYSSVFFDYSITNKPMIVYQYDYEKYTRERGMYFDIREELNSVNSIDELIEAVKNLIDCNILTSTVSNEFKNKYINYSGNATKECVDELIRVLEK